MDWFLYDNGLHLERVNIKKLGGHLDAYLEEARLIYLEMAIKVLIKLNSFMTETAII